MLFGEGDRLLTAFLIKIYKRTHQDPIGKTMLGPFHKPTGLTIVPSKKMIFQFSRF